MGKNSKRPRGPLGCGKIIEHVVLAFVFLAPCLLALAMPTSFGGTEARLWDGLFKLRYAMKGPELISPYIVNVVFDNESLGLISRATSERRIYAQLVDAVSDAGAKLIACDIIFAGTSVEADDDALAVAVREAGNVYFPFVPYGEDGRSLASFDDLTKASAGSGHIACDPDSDGRNRRFPLLYRNGGAFYPSLPLLVACEYLSVEHDSLKIEGERYVVLKGAAYPGGKTVDPKVPIDARGRIQVNYVAPRGKSFYTISAIDLLSALKGDEGLKRSLTDVLEDSIVFISDTSARNKDVGPGVFGDIIPYSEILLTVTNSILTRRFIASPPAFFLHVVLVVLLSLLSAASFFSRTLLRLLAPLGILVAYGLFASSLFVVANLLLPIALPAACIAFYFVAASVDTAFRAERKAATYWDELGRAKRDIAGLEKMEKLEYGKLDSTGAPAAPRDGLSEEATSENHDILPSGDGNQSPVRTAATGLKSPEAFEGIVTKNRTMISIFHEIEAYKSSDAPILIIGETGTGKELIAHAIHRASGRKGKYVAVNVAGINEELFNDTLFGHKRGAYTGAERDEIGFVEVAEGGTLFLDEIGDLSKASQIKLLRLIENKEYYPLNSKTLMKADVRIIAATNSDIDGKVREGSFRDDFARRLGLRMTIPPLRDRADDIELLLGHFIAKSAEKAGKAKPGYPRELADLLTSYRFPGNIRELESMVEEAVSKSESRELPLSVFKDRMAREMKSGEKVAVSGLGGHRYFSFSGDLVRLLGDIESSYVAEAMKASKGNRRKAAKILGVNYDWLKRRVKD